MTACDGNQPTHANIVLLCQAFSIIAVESAAFASTTTKKKSIRVATIP